jgi:secondary thiamine-phosphate synthase enzyme
VGDTITPAERLEPALELSDLEPAKRRTTRRVAADTGLGWHADADDRIVSRKLSAYQEVVEIRSSGRGFTDVTAKVQQVVGRSGLKTALCTVFIQHTSASLVIQENADPNVLRDLGDWAADLAPESRPWVHDDEGPDDMPAHARSAITKTSETIPVSAGRLALGTWQALYVWEHRARPHSRKLVVHLSGE